MKLDDAAKAYELFDKKEDVTKVVFKTGLWNFAYSDQYLLPYIIPLLQVLYRESGSSLILNLSSFKYGAIRE